MSKFEVGKNYEWYQREYGGFTVIRRTSRTITVTNNYSTWKMYTLINDNGDEFVMDRSVPQKWRWAFTCSANREAKEE